MFDYPLYGVSMSNPLHPILRVSPDVLPDGMLYDTVHSPDGQDDCEVQRWGGFGRSRGREGKRDISTSYPRSLLPL